MVLLIAIVALGRGGYSPWGSLALELGAMGLLFWILLGALWTTPPGERALLLEQRRQWKRLPFWARHPELGSFLRTASLGRFPDRTAGAQVEILPPGIAIPGANRTMMSSSHRDSVFLFGYPLPRPRLGILLSMLTLWTLFSLVPLGSEWADSLSPRAHALRIEAEELRGENPGASSPWSLAPFLTLRGLWLWLAYIALFYTGTQLAENPRTVETLTRLLLLMGVVFGLYGVGQWLFGLQELYGADPSTSGLRATGSFGNRNHYAAFMGMLLLCGVGWMGARRTRLSRPGSETPSTRRRGRDTREAKAKLAIAGLGMVMLSLGLIFSLSRSGISFALAGCGVFALLAGSDPMRTGPIELERTGGGRARIARSRQRRSYGRLFWALALAVVGVAFWIGIDPVVNRFELLPRQWEIEQGRGQVWLDSLGAVRDFWLTGSGLGSYRYVFPLYRSFGGQIFFSWAHNDYVQVLVELGFPGLFLVGWLMAAVCQAARQARRRLEDNPPLLTLHAGYCAAVVAIALHSFTDFSLHIPANAALLSVILGIVVQGPTKRRAA